MSEGKRREFGREFKLSAVNRILAGERVSALSRAIGVRPGQLYKWCKHFRVGGRGGSAAGAPAPQRVRGSRP